MFKRINQCDIYVGLWCIYVLQGVLYPKGVINQALQLVMLLWGVVIVFKYLTQYTERSSILKATFVLIIMYTIYGSIHIMFGEAIKMRDQYLYLQASLNSLVPIFVFYTFTADAKLTGDRIRIYLPFLIVTCILLYYEKESQVLMNTHKYKEEITNNSGYFFVALIPFLFFYSKKIILQYIFMAVIMVYVFMAMKRGAILVGVIGLAVLLYANLKNSSRWTKFLFALLTTAIVVGIGKFISYMMDNSAYFMARFEQTMDGNASGRDMIYGSLWNAILTEQTPFYFYFGRGADSTLKIAGDYAHQDWLETFCNNGLIGVLILFFFFYTFGKNVWRSRTLFTGMMFYSFATLFMIIFCKTLFSMSIQDLDIYESMLLGYFAYWVTQEMEETEELEVYE